MAENNEAPVIIKKVKKGGGGHHGGAWKVAYADFVTAMMALFIVLWILSASAEVREKVSQYFNNPKITLFGLSGEETLVTGSAISHKGIADEIEHEVSERERLLQKGKEILSEMEGSAEFASLSGQVEVEIIDEGLRIELTEKENKDMFFEKSSTKLKKSAQELLFLIGEQLMELPNKIVIEGHTDAQQFPANTRGYTNYELSADRANSARRALQKAGITNEQIDEIRGYAANRLRDKEHPLSSSNRRISIIVKFTENL